MDYVSLLKRDGSPFGHLDITSYQEKVIEGFMLGKENIRINAVAGAGKTTIALMLLWLAAQTTDKTRCYAVFNRSMAERLKSPDEPTGLIRGGCDVYTTYGLGMKLLTDRWRGAGITPRMEKWKIQNAIRAVLSRKGSPAGNLNDADRKLAVRAFTGWYNIMRLNRVDLENIKGLPSSSRAASVKYEEWYGKVAADISNAMRDQLVIGIHDYVDMVAGPCELGWLDPLPYDIMVVDEFQDTSKASEQVIFAHTDENTRVVVVGDPKQAIYAFAGGNAKALQSISARVGGQSYALPISYRLPKCVLPIAKKFSPDLDVPDWARSGSISIVNTDSAVLTIQDGDVFLTRNNAEAIQFAGLISEVGKTVVLFGDSEATDLRKILKLVMKHHLEASGVRCGIGDLSGAIASYESVQLGILTSEVNTDEDISRLNDDCNALANALRASKAKTIEALEEYIEKLYSMILSGDHITGSTGHRYKGHENDTIYLFGMEKCKIGEKMTPEQVEQERNLMGILVTRPKNSLILVTDKKEPVGELEEAFFKACGK